MPLPEQKDFKLRVFNILLLPVLLHGSETKLMPFITAPCIRSWSTVSMTLCHDLGKLMKAAARKMKMVEPLHGGLPRGILVTGSSE